MPDDEELRILDLKVKQLKLDYDRYFLGTRPREPAQPRAEVDKLIAVYSSQPIQNTALRFRFNGICSRYNALKRQWNETLRQIEAGTYTRHRFRADLHERERRGQTGPRAGPASGAPNGGGGDLFSEFLEARLACGQARISREQLERVLANQREELRRRFGGDDFRFRVVVEEGRAKLKASRAVRR